MAKRTTSRFTREDYQAYINSSAWRAVRLRYISSKLPKVCARCGKPWGKGDHLHHRTYKRFGNERLLDLVPLCEPCHMAVHELYDSDPKLKQRGLWYATREAIRHGRQDTVKPKNRKRRELVQPTTGGTCGLPHVSLRSSREGRTS